MNMPLSSEEETDNQTVANKVYNLLLKPILLGAVERKIITIVPTTAAIPKQQWHDGNKDHIVQAELAGPPGDLNLAAVSLPPAGGRVQWSRCGGSNISLGLLIAILIINGMVHV